MEDWYSEACFTVKIYNNNWKTFSDYSLSDPSVVCRVLPVCPVPARHGSVHTDQQTAGCRSGLTCGWWNGCQHRPWSGLHHHSGDVLLLRHCSEVCWRDLSLVYFTASSTLEWHFNIIRNLSLSLLIFSLSVLLTHPLRHIVNGTHRLPVNILPQSRQNGHHFFFFACYQKTEISLFQSHNITI